MVKIVLLDIDGVLTNGKVTTQVNMHQAKNAAEIFNEGVGRLTGQWFGAICQLTNQGWMPAP